MLELSRRGCKSEGNREVPSCTGVLGSRILHRGGKQTFKATGANGSSSEKWQVCKRLGEGKRKRKKKREKKGGRRNGNPRTRFL